MSSGPGPDAGDFPAPGSLVPGAPPPLRRSLTEADGVPVAATGSGGALGVQPGLGPDAPVGGSPEPSWHRAVLLAAGLVGAAAGLSLQQCWAERAARVSNVR